MELCLWFGPLAASKAEPPLALQHPAELMQDLGPTNTHVGISFAFISVYVEEETHNGN